MNNILITKSLKLPLSAHDIGSLQIGDKVLLTGEMLTARDAAHKQIYALIEKGIELPIEWSYTTLFYCGPSPTPAGRVCGAIGPTTSSRMDVYTIRLVEMGLRVMMGKGERADSVAQAIRDNGAIYLNCIGGAAAYLARHVVSCETFLWPELGAEAVFKLQVVDFPAYVAIV